MIVLLGVLLLVFGPKKLPEMGRSLGKGVLELHDGIAGESEPTQAVAPELDHGP